MFNSIRMWLGLAGAATMAILYSVFTSTRKENKQLKQENKSHKENLRIVEVKDEVTDTTSQELQKEEASIKEASISLQEQVKNETTPNNDLLDPEFIRLLNEDNNKV